MSTIAPGPATLMSRPQMKELWPTARRLSLEFSRRRGPGHTGKDPKVRWLVLMPLMLLRAASPGALHDAKFEAVMIARRADTLPIDRRLGAIMVVLLAPVVVLLVWPGHLVTAVVFFVEALCIGGSVAAMSLRWAWALLVSFRARDRWLHRVDEPKWDWHISEAVAAPGVRGLDQVFRPHLRAVAPGAVVKVTAGNYFLESYYRRKGFVSGRRFRRTMFRRV